MIVLQIGSPLSDKSVFNNILELDEIILPFEWHSFCISFDLVKNRMKLYHNDHIQAVQNFTKWLGEKESIQTLMSVGHLGGQRFVGFLSDFQIFGSPLPEAIILEWTTCQNQVSRIQIVFKANNLHSSNLVIYTPQRLHLTEFNSNYKIRTFDSLFLAKNGQACVGVRVAIARLLKHSKTRWRNKQKQQVAYFVIL